MRGEDCVARRSTTRGGGAFLVGDRVVGGGVVGGGGVVLVLRRGEDPDVVDDLRTDCGDVAWVLPPGEIS